MPPKDNTTTTAPEAVAVMPAWVTASGASPAIFNQRVLVLTHILSCFRALSTPKPRDQGAI